MVRGAGARRWSWFLHKQSRNFPRRPGVWSSTRISHTGSMRRWDIYFLIVLGTVAIYSLVLLPLEVLGWLHFPHPEEPYTYWSEVIIPVASVAAALFAGVMIYVQTGRTLRHSDAVRDLQDRRKLAALEGALPSALSDIGACLDAQRGTCIEIIRRSPPINSNRHAVPLTEEWRSSMEARLRAAYANARVSMDLVIDYLVSKDPGDRRAHRIHRIIQFSQNRIEDCLEQDSYSRSDTRNMISTYRELFDVRDIFESIFHQIDGTDPEDYPDFGSVFRSTLRRDLLGGRRRGGSDPVYDEFHARYPDDLA